jgi:EAL domain-containing protein (putative c-di-GMP-specific phosphodiesterase class I)
MTYERQCILLVDDDFGITEGLSYAMEREGRTVVVCTDIEAAELVLSRYPVTHLITDLQFSGDFGFEGLHFVRRVQAQVPNCRVILITGYATDALRKAALAHGASDVLSKPFGIYELEDAITRCNAGSEAISGEPYQVIRIPAMEDLLHDDSVTIAFQPIVRFTEDGPMTFAYEALTRVRGNWLTGGPVMLFEYAERRNQLAELNVLTMSRAIEAAASLPEDARVFINVDPMTFHSPKLVSTLLATAARSGVSLDRLVIEVTERSGFTDDDEAAAIFAQLREAGVRFALDDHGSAYSHLSQINRIRPSFIKISMTFGTAFEQDETKRRIIRHTVALARDFGCETILEGIETDKTAVAAAEAGVTLAQGFHFGRPSPASHWISMKTSSLQAA